MTTVASAPGAESPAGRAPLSLWQLVLIFVRTGSLAWGGGGATLAMLRTEFCARRPLVSDAEFQLLFGLTRLLPGMNLLSLTVLLGYRTHRLPGAVLSLVGLTVPSFAIILVGCHLLRGGHRSPLLDGAVRGLGIGAGALLVETGWQLCQASLAKLGWRSRGFWLALMGASIGLGAIEGLSAAWIMVAGGLIGAALSPWMRGR